MTETSPAEDADAPTRLRVDTASRSYEIIIGEDLIGDAARYLEPVMSFFGPETGYKPCNWHGKKIPLSSCWIS